MTSKPALWKSVPLSPELRQRCARYVHDTVVLLADRHAFEPVYGETPVSLAGGLAGGCLVLGQIAALDADLQEELGLRGDGLQEAVSAQTDRLLDLFSDVSSVSLLAGATGVGWVLQALHRWGHLAEDPCEELDLALLDFLHKRVGSSQSEYDLISGDVGIGLYLLERLPSPSAVAGLKEVLRILGEAAERSARYVTWFTHPARLPEWQREIAPGGWYNLGLAHGIPGIIGLLGRAAKHAPDDVFPLLNGGVQWLLDQRQPEDSPSAFAEMLLPGSAHSRSATRLAWCYGDPGVASALLVAGRGAQRADWSAEAIRTLKRSLARDFSRTGVVDAALCHGAAGLAQLSLRFWQASGDDFFSDRVQYWLEQALALPVDPAWPAPSGQASAAVSTGRFPAPHEDTPAGAEFLEGRGGVVLAMSSALASTAPGWDRVLLLAD